MTSRRKQAAVETNDKLILGQIEDMSEVPEEAIDSSAVSEEDVEDQQETSQDDQSSPNKGRSKIPETI
ncbi:hypothetical protein PAMP_002549 [Pampus punctatissimus]